MFLVRAIAGEGRHALIWAAVFTALAAGVRPQVGLALLPAAAVAAGIVFRRERSVKPLLLAAAVGVLLSAAIWIPVFRSSGGFAVWKDRFEGQMKYVTTYDSPKPRDVMQPPFWKRWFLDPVGHGKLAGTFLLLGLAGAALERKKAGMIFLVFVPVTLLTLGVLSVDSAPRYVLAFWAAPCALAALALDRIERTRIGRFAAPAAAVFVLAAFAALGAPAVAEVASKPSPSVGAMRAVLAAGIAPGDVYVTEPLRAHADEYFRYAAHVVSEREPVAIPTRGVFVGADDRPFGVVPQRVFTFDHPRLVHISRGRYLRTEIFESRAGAGVFVPDCGEAGLAAERARRASGGDHVLREERDARGRLLHRDRRRRRGRAGDPNGLGDAPDPGRCGRRRTGIFPRRSRRHADAVLGLDAARPRRPR